MGKIGILFGMEQSFPKDILQAVNNMKEDGISAEYASIGAVKMNNHLGYTVILDRVSHEVPFYRAMLKLAAINGVRVINNPFWNAVDDNFFQISLAQKIGLSVPKTVVLPSKNHPYGTSAESMKNLVYPIDWEEIFEYIGFPAVIRPNLEHSPMNDFKIYNRAEFFAAYDQTGSSVMILQESIPYEQYFRIYVVGTTKCRIVNFDPKKPHHLRFPKYKPEINDTLARDIEQTCSKMSHALGLEFNAIEVAVNDGKHYVIDTLHPAPGSDPAFLRKDDYQWLVKNTSQYLVELAKKGRAGSQDYSWNSLIYNLANGKEE